MKLLKPQGGINALESEGITDAKAWGGKKVCPWNYIQVIVRG